MKPERVTPAQRQAVLARVRGRCEYCHTPDGFVPGSFAVEHIVPRSKGGRTRLDNLALSCPACNGHKYNKVEGADPHACLSSLTNLWRDTYTSSPFMPRKPLMFESDIASRPFMLTDRKHCCPVTCRKKAIHQLSTQDSFPWWAIAPGNVMTCGLQRGLLATGGGT
jgi:HNH endonuclease